MAGRHACKGRGRSRRTFKGSKSVVASQKEQGQQFWPQELRTSDDNRILSLEVLTPKATAAGVVAPCLSLFDQILVGKLGKQGGGGGKQVVGTVTVDYRYLVGIMAINDIIVSECGRKRSHTTSS